MKTSPEQNRVSIVIRSFTRTDELFRLLDSLGRQTLLPAEIVVIDSGSADLIVARLREWSQSGYPSSSGHVIPLRLIEIPSADFQSARALNRAIQESASEYVGIISQDALPVNESYLEILAEAVQQDRVAGAYGRQTLNGKRSALAEKDLLLTYPPKARIQKAPDCWFVNTCSIIRRVLWEQHPFDERAVISEDHEWAKWVQQRGYEIRYEADAMVYHFHDFPRSGELWNRFYMEGKGLAYIHGRRMSAARAIFNFAREVASDSLWLLRKGSPWKFPISAYRRGIKHAALYRGFRDGFPAPKDAVPR
jgi:GT2 family glycosyltransferase